MQQLSMPPAKMLDQSVNTRPPGHQRDPYWQDFGTARWRLASGTIRQVLLSRKSREFRTQAPGFANHCASLAALHISADGLPFHGRYAASTEESPEVGG